MKRRECITLLGGVAAALAHIRSRHEVGVTTGSEINDWCRKRYLNT
jgi:hypothetical protein